ncbi:oxidoreductase [Nocardia miyunensis]|uniref:oxidoreductase n=1 Tax=Nocardia miyunensis TaxID=282684 RepID=UPI00083424BF|nr:FAD-dependent oxidoreductase [Nocardia miyunensis]
MNSTPDTTGQSQYPLTLSPWTLGSLTMRNRILVGAHGTNYQSGGLPSPRYAAYMAERARGGAGLVITEGTHVHPTTGGPFMMDAWRRDGRESFERLTGAVHDEGGRIFCQLMHNGRQQEPVLTGRPAVGPSALADPAHSTTAHELSNAEILELIEAFADSAANMIAVGFDGIELHCAHGYLIEEFLSPWSNHRTDQWGGSPQNRLRFARSVVRAILDRVGSDVVVGARVTAYETVPGGLDRDEALDITAALAAEGLSFVSVTAGQHATPFMVVPPAGTPTLPFAADVARVRSTVDCAVFASHRVRTLADAEQAISAGIADMVNMARAHIADPFVVAKTMQGRTEEIRQCIGCVQGCRGQLMSGLPIGCLVNPRAGRESTPLPDPVVLSKNIAVVGGGIAGMQFASTAAARGHQVTLFEAADQLGGMFARSATLPERQEVARFTEVLATELRHNNVRVELGHSVGPDDLSGYDQVVVAIGASRHAPVAADLPEARMPIVGLEQALDLEVPEGNRVLIVDRGDHHNVALLLARRYEVQGAAQVTVVDTEGPVARKLDILNRGWMTREFDPERVRLVSSAKDLEVTGRRASFRHEGFSQTVDDLDVLVVLEPAIARDPEPWRQCAPEVLFLGDADAPGLAVELVHHAYELAGDLVPGPGRPLAAQVSASS